MPLVRTARPSPRSNLPARRSLPPISSPINPAPVATSAEAPETSAKERARALERPPRVLAKARATLSHCIQPKPPAMSAKAELTPARTSVSAPPRAQAKSPRGQVAVLARYFTITIRRRQPRFPPNRKTRPTPGFSGHRPAPLQPLSLASEVRFSPESPIPDRQPLSGTDVSD